MELLALSKRGEVPTFDIVPLKATVGGVPSELWKIDATIPQLAYLSHNFFRYYGKFPSVLARRLIKCYSEPGDVVLDNMAGCGTTLLEAMLLGRSSVGFDINPLGVLAANVKTNSRRVADYKRKWQRLTARVHEELQGGLFARETVEYKLYIPDRPDITKWFTRSVIHDLAKVRALIARVRDQEFREFLTLAFAAIIRRVSNAYDGEVRPHINPTKRPRPVLDAFTEKITDMLVRLECQDPQLPDRNVSSRAIVWDSRLPFEDIQQRIDLVISHPPYLNCFNYIPVYRWEMLWLGLEPGDHASKEVISWPAKPALIERYYAENLEVIRSGVYALRKGGRYCIVIGDCTVKGVLEKTHVRFMEMCGRAGLELERLIYRDTYYATGRYAYSHRAEYNYDASDEKRDVILVCRKP